LFIGLHAITNKALAAAQVRFPGVARYLEFGGKGGFRL
jgi:hypothetical protein